MHAPNWICKKLEEVHPWARIGWMGRKRSAPDELNPGQFVVLQLYHQRDAKHTMLEQWNHRGPVYGSHFDPLCRVPVMVKAIPASDLQQYGWGIIVDRVREWIQPIKKRIDDCEAESTARVDAAYTDMAHEVVGRMHHCANKTGATRPKPIAKKFLTKRERAILCGDIPLKKPKVGLGDLPKEVGKLR